MKILKNIYKKIYLKLHPNKCPNCLKGDIEIGFEHIYKKDLGLKGKGIGQEITYEYCNKCDYRLNRMVVGYLKGGF